MELTKLYHNVVRIEWKLVGLIPQLSHLCWRMMQNMAIVQLVNKMDMFLDVGPCGYILY